MLVAEFNIIFGVVAIIAAIPTEGASLYLLAAADAALGASMIIVNMEKLSDLKNGDAYTNPKLLGMDQKMLDQLGTALMVVNLSMLAKHGLNKAADKLVNSKTMSALDDTWAAWKRQVERDLATARVKTKAEGMGEGRRFTGAGINDYDKAAEAEYESIRNVKMKDIEKVARNTGLGIDEIRTMKKHLFFGKHQIPQPGGREYRLERFAADDEIAFAWKTAQKGELSVEQKAWFKQLAEHELTERKLMAEGQKYRTLESWNHEKGTYDGFPPGAHENAPSQPTTPFPGYEEYFFNKMFK